MKIRLVAAAIGLLFGSCFLAVAQHSEERVVVRLPIEKNEPLEIADIKVNGQHVALDKKFVAGDDWMSTLTFTVKNTSDKRILFANFDLFFFRPSESSKTGSLFDLVSYGKYALTNRSPSESERLIGLGPGETIEIGFTAQRFTEVTRFLADLGFPQSVESVSFRLGSVIFDDDTMWTRSEYFRRDPSNPSRWNNARP